MTSALAYAVSLITFTLIPLVIFTTSSFLFSNSNVVLIN